MPIERLSIKRVRVLGTFPAVLDDLNFKFSRGRLQTNCQSIHSNITSPYWWESKTVSKGCAKWENWEVRIDMAKNIMATPLKVRCKTLCRPNAAACNATILNWCVQKAFLKKARACTCHTLHTGATGSRDDLFPVVWLGGWTLIFALPWEVCVRDESLITASAWTCC